MKTGLGDDCFALPPGISWTPVDTALARLREGLNCVTETETVPSRDALGRILARPVVAARSNPPTANSAIDGYAFAWASLGSVGPEASLPLEPGRAAAGHPFNGSVPEGHAMRILTGAEMPTGTDTVVLQEDAETSVGRVQFRVPKSKGANSRGSGEDARAGDVVFPAGRKLRVADLARLASVGVTEVEVRHPLRVAVISTGDELIPDGEARKDGIFDANRPMLLAMVREFGHTPIDLGMYGDNADLIRAALDRGASEADAILTTGGASAGDEDYISAILGAEGLISTWRIAVKPGRPLALGLWQGVPVFGMPGNPVAAFVCSLIFARPALGQLAGQDWADPTGFTVPAAFEKVKKPGRREYIRARLNADGAVEAFHSEGSGLVGGLSWSDGLVELPDEAAVISPGTMVRYLPYTSFGLRL